MDCRRQAQKRGLVIRGPRKIWDSTLALRGMMYAKREGPTVLRRYHDTVFERFWKRELDIEDPGVIGMVLAGTGANTTGLPTYLAYRLLFSVESCFGAASTYPTFARCSAPRPNGGDARARETHNRGGSAQQKERLSPELRLQKTHNQAKYTIPAKDYR